jgi:hypothetical protein
MATNHGPFRTRLPAIRQVVAGTWKPEDPHGERVLRFFMSGDVDFAMASA